jgi:prolipoprotein diacylglyceryl transferase
VIAELVALHIPSPSEGVWHLGPLPIRAYALCIILGVFVAVWFGEKRWVARGGAAGQVGDVAIWAVPAGLVGARVYHVITDHDLYFGHGRHVVDALKVWHGGLGIWGAIAGGVVGGVFACRHFGIRFRPLLDALAPALLMAQVIGRFGNYFNQELYGGRTTLPWGLEIDAAHAPKDANGQLVYPADTVYHPTFLYEAIWNVGAIALILWADRKLKLGFGRVFALYVLVYCAGRGWIENLRVDKVEYNDVLGLRLNVWTSIILGTGALIYFVVAGRKHPKPDTREESVYAEGRAPETDSGQESPDSGQPEDDGVDEDPTSGDVVQDESPR